MLGLIQKISKISLYELPLDKNFREFIDLFIWKSDKDGESSLIHWLIPQTAVTARSEPSWRQACGARNASVSVTRMTEIQRAILCCVCRCVRTPSSQDSTWCSVTEYHTSSGWTHCTATPWLRNHSAYPHLCQCIPVSCPFRLSPSAHSRRWYWWPKVVGSPPSMRETRMEFLDLGIGLARYLLVHASGEASHGVGSRNPSTWAIICCSQAHAGSGMGNRG